MLTKCRYNLQSQAHTHSLLHHSHSHQVGPQTKQTQYRTLGHADIWSHPNWFYFLLLSGRHICHALRYDFKCEREPGKMCHHVGSAHPPQKNLSESDKSDCASLRPVIPEFSGKKSHSRNFIINTVHLHLTMPSVYFLCTRCYHAAPLLCLLC